ncbi:MAG: M56 family metallopeptidase [Actinobacteria bacterium]|nr:M56 family metallopeptidase [Actinomycetota bacterium]
MLAAALLLLAVVVLLCTAVPARLARASWCSRSPVLALVLWQAVGLAGGVVALEAASTVALAPFGSTHLAALRHLQPSRAPWWSWTAAAVALAVFLRLTSVLVSSTARTLQTRRRHRILLDVVAAPSAALAGARVLAHDVPVAYCLPGLRPRVVLSRGVLDRLRDDEVAAVLAHERAHLTARHDLVVLPFVALGATFPRLPAVRTARLAVALLIEMLADDRAVRRHDRSVLARALVEVGTAAVPAGGLGAGGDDVLLRASRLLHPPPPLPRPYAVLVLATAALVAALPALGLLLPLV